MQPLHGIRVLDFTTLLPGPLATLMLAEAGAEVIKVERPGGDELRAYPPHHQGMSVLFAVLNRGKKSVVVDLKTQAGRAQAEGLIAASDVLVEQFRPGVMDRLGLGYDAARAINPGIVYCAISGYGKTGPRAGAAGHDLNYMALSGLLALSCGTPEHPVLPPTQIADIGGGSFPAVINILMALYRREKTGQGAFLDISMAEAMFAFACFALAEGQARGCFPASGGGLLTGGLARYNLYACADGRMLAVAALEPKFWQAFCDVIGLAEDGRDDFADAQGVRRRVAEILRRRTAAQWEKLFATADCCATVVRTLGEALDDVHFRGRGLFDHRVELPGGGDLVAAAVPLDPGFRAAAEVSEKAPLLGADNEEVLAFPEAAGKPEER